MPVRNEAPHVGSVLDQLCRQTLAPERFEIVVVDGMSDDGTREVVREAARRRPQIRLLDNPGFLSGSARNIGVADARAPYILFIDGHCRLESPTLLEATLEAFESGERCLSRPQPLIADGVGHYQQAVSLARSSWMGHAAGSKIYRDEDRYCNPLSAGCAYTRDLYRELGGIDESFDAGEDLEFNLRVHRHGVRAFHSQRFSVSYHPRGSFRSLFRQLFRYGYGRAHMARKHPGTVSPLAVLLALLSLWLLALPVLGVLWRPAWRLWLTAAAPYAAIVLLSSGWLARRGGSLLWAATASCFPAIHLGAGLGYLSGLVGGPTWRHGPAAPGSSRRG